MYIRSSKQRTVGQDYLIWGLLEMPDMKMQDMKLQDMIIQDMNLQDMTNIV